MKIYTDRFETVLPGYIRERVKSAPRPKAADIRGWALLAALAFSLGAFMMALSGRPPHQEGPVPEWAHSKRDGEYVAPIYSPSEEVRRAQLVNPGPGWRQATMPYGENVWARYLGELPNQEALPPAGNQIGDTYRIGQATFVWVNPGGVAQWIDP